MVLVCVLCCIGHCFGAAPSLSLSLLSSSVICLSLLLSLSLCLFLALSVLCGRAETTTNNKEFSRVFLCVRACVCVRGWLPTGWLLWWHDCSNARIVVDDVLENCFTVLRVKSTFVSFLLIFDLTRFPEPVLTLGKLHWKHCLHNILYRLWSYHAKIMLLLNLIFCRVSKNNKIALRTSRCKIKDVHFKPKHSLVNNISFKHLLNGHF